MGLDIEYHERAERLDPQPVEVTDELIDDETLVHAFVYNGFEQSMRGLTDGWYRVSGETGRFRAGSYSGYNQFRIDLCKAALGVAPELIWANVDDYQDKPFFELIHFADNEGTIGPEAAADLARDFAEHREVVLAKWADHADGDYLCRKYDEWTQAFTVAARGGIVVFA